MRMLLATAAAALLATGASAVTVVNGSFEDGIALPDGGFTTLATGDTTSLPGWEVLSDGVDYIGTYWQASNGSRSLDLSAATSGGVMQTVTGFETGKRYKMTFDVSGNPGGGDNPKGIMVSATGGVAQEFFYLLTPANSNSNMLYQTYTYYFTASSGTQDIQFRSAEYNPYGSVLDNVSISLVPEPATWGLMLAGFAMTGGLVRRRARMKSLLA